MKPPIPTTLTIYRPEEPGRSASHPIVRRTWLPRIGPTAYLLLLELEENQPTELELEEMARRLGVSPAVLHRTLDRLHRHKVVYYAPAEGVLVSDGTFPKPQPRVRVIR